MDLNDMKEQLKTYIDLISRIRILSAVWVEEKVGAEGYRQQLQKNYQIIGELRGSCTEILDRYIYPFLDQKEPLTKEICEILQTFCVDLLEPASGEELDLFLLYELSACLLQAYPECLDDCAYVRQLHIHINVCYALVNKTARITVTKAPSDFYMKDGLGAAKLLLEYVSDREKFLRLGINERCEVLRGARFCSALYDTFYWEEERNVIRYQLLVNAVGLSEDPFYAEQVGDYDMLLYRCRCMEHMGQLTERGNRWGFKQEQCEEICIWLEKLEKEWEQNERVQDFLPEAHLRLILLRNAYFAQKIDTAEYQKELIRLYQTYRSDAYDMYAVQINLLIPAEYLAALKGKALSVRQENILQRIYLSVIDYVLKSVNMDAFNYLQEYLVAFLEEFIEIPGFMTFEEMVLHCIAAIHPPTYVHTRQVAEISRCLAAYLLEKCPELFAAPDGLKDAADVLAHRSEILYQIYHGALCHDFGKITMIDSIFVYGRKLFDREFELIRLHSEMGAKMLSSFPSTAGYAQIARNHHIWFNRQGGYPQSQGKCFDIASDIVQIADCIDAATDQIGRSYSRGKTLEEVVEELRRDSGIRYAPYVVELFDQKDVCEDIRSLLQEGRQENYRNTYQLFR